MAAGEGRIKKVLRCLQDPDVGRIVVFSMNGGVGKTWTARHAMRRAMDTDIFDIFVWVTLSVDLNWRHAQRRIAENLFIPIPSNRADDGGEIVSMIREEIWRILSEKRFLLVLDDAWLVEDDALYLMGVPCPGPENLSKVIVTTRSTRTFVVMQPATVIEPQALPAKESWSLFCDVAGKSFTSPVVLLPVAQTVRGECSGVPLLIILIAGALREIKHDWLLGNQLRRASSVLRDDAEQLTFQTMYRVVQFSYDALPSDSMKDCFLYCTFFAGAGDVNSEELIRYWVLEGLFDGYGYLHEAYKQGRMVLEELVNRGVLIRESGDRVSMHDVVREVALEIAIARGITSYARVGMLLTVSPNQYVWTNFMRISLMYNLLRTLPECPRCSNLSTLLLKGNQFLTEVPNAFFDHMEKLRVLDLSYTGIQWLPTSISKLLDLRVLLLRGCQSLSSVMELHTLEKLEVVDLSETPVRSLHFLGNLANLRHLSLRRCQFINSELHLEVLTMLKELDLSGTTLVEFPYEISKLTQLKRVDLSGTRYTRRFNWEALQWLPESLNWDNCDVSDIPMELVREDGGVYVTAGNSDFFSSLDKNSHLWESIFRKFHFYVCPSLRGSLENDICFQRKKFIFRDIYFESRHFTHSVEHTKYLEICGVDSYPKGIEGVLNNAELVFLNNNAFMKKLSDLGFENMRVMKECWIERCDQAEVVFRGDDVQVIAAIGRLENLWISNLANLRHLCEGRERLTSFSSLKHLHVDCCPNLVRMFSSALHLENLISLQIKFCDKLESVFGESVPGQEMLPQLRTFRLWELPELKSICEGHLPSLKMMKVKECPKLKKLPLDANDIRPLVEIRGERWWWNNLTWEDERIEVSLHFRNWGLF